jgi:hypothetical protein
MSVHKSRQISSIAGNTISALVLIPPSITVLATTFWCNTDKGDTEYLDVGMLNDMWSNTTWEHES